MKRWMSLLMAVVCLAVLCGALPAGAEEPAEPEVLCPGEGVSIAYQIGWYSANLPDKAIDSDMTTYAGANTTAAHEFVIDLGSVQPIGKVELWGTSGTTMSEYELYGSDDNANYKKTYLGELKSPETVKVNGLTRHYYTIELTASARFVRVSLITGSNSNIFEMKIYKGQEAQQLGTPAGLSWDGSVLSWDAVEHAEQYDVVLYKNGIFVDKFVNIAATSVDMKASMRLTGSYTATVAAKATGYLSGDTSEASAENQYQARDNLAAGAGFALTPAAEWFGGNTAPAKCADGDFTTYASSRNNFASSLVLDLQAVYSVREIDMYMNTCTVPSLDIYYSLDGQTYTKADETVEKRRAVTVSECACTLFDADVNLMARYLKFTEPDLYQTNLWELEIFGAPDAGQTLEAMAAPVWETDTAVRFTPVANAETYTVTLYRDGAVVASKTGLTGEDTLVDFQSDMTASGLYTAAAYAEADGYNPSPISPKSAENDYLAITNMALSKYGAKVTTMDKFYSNIYTNANDGDYGTEGRSQAVEGTYFVLDMGQRNLVQEVLIYSVNQPNTQHLKKMIYHVYYGDTQEETIAKTHYAGQLSFDQEVTIDGINLFRLKLPACFNARYLMAVSENQSAASIMEFEAWGTVSSDMTAALETHYNQEYKAREATNAYTKYILPALAEDSPYSCRYSVEAPAEIANGILTAVNDGTPLAVTMEFSLGKKTLTVQKLLEIPMAQDQPVELLALTAEKSADGVEVYALAANDNIKAKPISVVVAQYSGNGLASLRILTGEAAAMGAEELEINETVAIADSAECVRVFAISSLRSLDPLSEEAIAIDLQPKG